MSMFDHDERWSEDEMRDIAKVWSREGKMSALLDGFAGHPDEQLAARAVAEMTAKKEKPREIRFIPPADRFDRWQKAANSFGIPLTVWVQLAADGMLPHGKTGETSTAPVQETAQGKPERNPLARPENGWIWERILAELAKGNIRELRHSEVPALAKALGEPSRAVSSSLGSMVGSGRLRHDKLGKTYHVVTEN